MNSRRSLDSGRIWVLGHDQVKQQLQFFISGQRAVILIVGIISFFKRKEFTHDFFHVQERNITVIKESTVVENPNLGFSKVPLPFHLLAEEFRKEWVAVARLSTRPFKFCCAIRVVIAKLSFISPSDRLGKEVVPVGRKAGVEFPKD